MTMLQAVEAPGQDGLPAGAARVRALAGSLDDGLRRPLIDRLRRFVRELEENGKPFDFSDCAVGNLVFAGSFLTCGRDFNAAIDDYCGLLGLSSGLIENVTDGTNAFLVAIDIDDRLLGSEAEIVDAKRRNRVKDIYLVDRVLTDDERRTLEASAPSAVTGFLEGRLRPITVNPRLIERIANADLLIYSPGTQHSSLFPSYLTPGLSAAIAGNLTAIKLLVTNIQADAEITGSSAVDIIERAIYYLKEKGQLGMPTPCLITHYVINDPGHVEAAAPYVPLGRLETLEDPRLVRIGHYEDGVSGRHDAEKILTPFLESLLTVTQPPTVAVWLHHVDSLNKISQTILEMLRGGIERAAVRIVVYYSHPNTLDPTFTGLLPFDVRRLEGGAVPAGALFQAAVQAGGFEYAVLFESSGMYQGEDLVDLVTPLGAGRLDAVWGSRRLSVRDIEASVQFRYRHKRLLGLASAFGTQALSLTCLLLFGRYVSDTLSGAWAVRASYLAQPRVDLGHKLANQYVLSALLSAKADLLETPVRFFSISPERVRRISVLEGIQSLLVIARQRLRERLAHTLPAVSQSQQARTEGRL
jgi:2-phospho-L-lactate transferase CofD